MSLQRMGKIPALPGTWVKRSVLPVLSAGLFLWSTAPAQAATAGQHIEKQFNVSGRPVVVIHNVANGRIEVKSWKNKEVDVVGTQTSNKIGFEIEQVGDRIDVTANILDPAAQPLDLEANLQLTVPEETELQLKSETGLIYVEQVTGDMKLESYGGDVHLKEVSGYIIVNAKNVMLLSYSKRSAECSFLSIASIVTEWSV